MDSKTCIKDGLDKSLQIKKLSVYGNLASQGESLTGWLAKLDRLEILSLRAYKGDNLLHSSPCSLPRLRPFSNNKLLYRLRLEGKFADKLLETHEFPPNLTTLTLQHCQLKEDPMPTLEKLHSLRSLELLAHAYTGKKMVCSSGNFRQLEILKIDRLYELENWIVEEGGVQRLKGLHILSCEKLEMMPDGLQYIKTLQELKVRGMPQQFITSRLQKPDGIDWSKIQHIPSITMVILSGIIEGGKTLSCQDQIFSAYSWACSSSMDAAVVVSLLSHKLQTLLNDEAIAITPKVKDQVQRTNHQLNLFRRLLKEAEKNQALAVEINSNQWTSHLLRALYSLEDAIDTFVVKKALQTQKPFTSYHNQVVLIKKMKEFISKTGNLLKDNQPLDMQDMADNNIPGPSQHQRWGRISRFCFDDESHTVGLEEQVNNLASLVVQEAEQGNQPAVVSMVGEAGSGKTAIARIIYNRVDIKQHFTSRVWVRVTKEFKLRDVLVDMISQLDEKVANESLFLDELRWRLPKLLGQGRCLIVVDDVDAPEFWEEIKDVFPTSPHGGVVIVTTRKADVAVSSAGSTLHVRPLNDDESWALFLKKLEVTEDRLHDCQLIKFKEQILKLCGGLPLAIALMGGLLSAKELTDSEWLKVIEYVNAVEDILALSYHELPSYLKPCFLYMGLFPKATEISVRRLIHLWVAEGFVTSLCDSDMVEEDLAEMYFEELVCRKIIEVVRWKLDGSPKTCRLPSFVHDVFSSKARDIGFFQIHSKSFSTSKSQLPVRRLATYSNAHFSRIHINHLRSYVSFNTLKGGIPAGNSSMFLDKIVRKRNLEVFQVLDLESVYKPQLPKVMLNLLNLRYLGLRSTAISSLPVSISNLQFLETLDVKHTNITTLPDSFWKLGNLRHLYLNGIFLDSLEALSLASLNKLQTLCGLSIGTESLVAETFSKLTRLRKLHLTFYIPTSIKVEFTSQLKKLHSLKIKSIRESGERASIKFKSFKELQNLVDLYLFGGLLRPFDARILPPNLKSLTLSKTGLEKDPMPVLGKLPHLYSLRLFNFSYIGEEMTCLSGAFPQLHVLKLWQLDHLNKWVVKQGALTSLRELEIRDCRSLETLDAFYQLTSLRELMITNMSQDFVDHVKVVGRALGGKSLDRENALLRKYSSLWKIMFFTL
ncbi:Disease resistance protein [Corchorus capsularis]|uniref:Disease resistance protein n=1 Tax=Corchorus capsularis TaxID=210143 RepID=A0A1R3HK11_COCAP|nr:Disease resistance protein [Corchorus capsularis]